MTEADEQYGTEPQLSIRIINMFAKKSGRKEVYKSTGII